MISFCKKKLSLWKYHKYNFCWSGGSSTHGIVWGWIGPMLSWTFNALWILPLFVLSKVINSLWFQVSIKSLYMKWPTMMRVMSLAYPWLYMISIRVVSIIAQPVHIWRVWNCVASNKIIRNIASLQPGVEEFCLLKEINGGHLVNHLFHA